MLPVIVSGSAGPVLLTEADAQSRPQALLSSTATALDNRRVNREWGDIGEAATLRRRR